MYDLYTAVLKIHPTQKSGEKTINRGALQIKGKNTMALDSVERTDNGYLVNSNDWNEEIGAELFAEEGVEATDRHWDIVRYVREQTLAGDEPNERSIMKAMSKLWGEKATSKLMYEMFFLLNQVP